MTRLIALGLLIGLLGTYEARTSPSSLTLRASMPALRAGMSGLRGIRTGSDTPDIPARSVSEGGDPPALKLPPGWKKSDPLPVKKTNCVRCHLTAGRELTAPVRDFARSVHDLAKLSCNNCHGGDTSNDPTAHEPEHAFIGTKLSAHMAACSECHAPQAQAFRKGKHFWDLSKSINRSYPVCIDCHGNHDIGKPPAEFALVNVCTDCHKQFAKDLPQAAAVVAANDRLWKVLRKVHAKNQSSDDPTPEAFRTERNRVRTLTARLMHRAASIAPQEAQAINDRANKLVQRLEAWLQQQK